MLYTHPEENPSTLPKGLASGSSYPPLNELSHWCCLPRACSQQARWCLRSLNSQPHALLSLPGSSSQDLRLITELQVGSGAWMVGEGQEKAKGRIQTWVFGFIINPCTQIEPQDLTTSTSYGVWSTYSKCSISTSPADKSLPNPTGYQYIGISYFFFSVAKHLTEGAEWRNNWLPSVSSWWEDTARANTWGWGFTSWWMGCRTQDWNSTLL